MARERSQASVPWPSERRLIINADDFGSSPTVNAAVIRAHREGVLTSASIMAGGAAFEQAVDIAKATPDLAVGLHLVTVDGPAALSPMRLRHIVGPDGTFVGTPLGLGVRYAFAPAARRELAAELTAQFERFAATGLPLSHVNGHLHMHMHPTVLNLVVSLAVQHGARGMRLPRDSLRLGLAYDWRHLGTKLVWAVAFALLCRHGQAVADRAGLATVDRVYGLMQSGHMTETYVVSVLRHLDTPTAEIYFHPDTRGPDADEGERGLGPNRDDLLTLLNPAVVGLIRESGIRLASYSDLL